MNERYIQGDGNNNVVGLWFLWTALVLLIGIWIGGCAEDRYYHSEAVKHNAAYYNSTNGEFTWVDKK